MSETTPGKNMADRREWHLDKSLSVGHILTTVMILGALSIQYAQFTARLAVLEAGYSQLGNQLGELLDNQRRVDARQDLEIAETKKDIRDQYLRMNQQLAEVAASQREIIERVAR